MKMKSQYLSENLDIDKTAFLNAFSESNEWLAENYSGLAIDEYSKQIFLNADYRKQRDIRINNARILYEGLEANQDIGFLFPIHRMTAFYCPCYYCKWKT